MLIIEGGQQPDSPVSYHSAWRPISEFTGSDVWDKVDLWLSVAASPRSMGMSDEWRVVDCWRKDGKWWHYHEMKVMELESDYITHFMPRPQGPSGQTAY